ncbi:MAG: nickel-dependent hydrogenase large subunit [Helicobacteraceae bacterium]
MSSTRIVVDPITRIEGHLRVEVEVDENNVITNAYSSSTLWRGIETIVRGRDPRDVGFMVQRICGVCTYSHYRAGISAVEDALGIKIPYNAQLLRTLMNYALFLHDHPVHFYQLHGVDWVDIVNALQADPKKASDEAFLYTDNPIGTGADRLLEVKKTIEKFAKGKSLGPFANAYWGHKTYRFTPEQNLIALSHYLMTLEYQREVAQMMAIFGAKQPHPQSLTVGGVTSVMDMLDPSRMGEYLIKFQKAADFVMRAYYADVVMAGKVYANEPSVTIPMNLKNFIAKGAFTLNRKELLFDSGVILDGDLSRVYDIDESKITEDATHSWYKENGPFHPYDGKTNPNYTGFVDGKSLNAEGKMESTPLINEKGKYSWIKSPRYDNKPMEVGPLASLLVSYVRGNKKVQKSVDEFLQKTGLPVTALFTTLGRTAARMLQSSIIAQYGLETFNELAANIKSGDTETCTIYKIDKDKEYKGRFIGDVPRGMLSHWVRIKNGVVENYQAVVPSTWNSGPEDKDGHKGAYEHNLIGIKVQDPTQPLEIIRSIHSYDPCIACAVHITNTKGVKLSEYKVFASCGV